LPEGVAVDHARSVREVEVEEEVDLAEDLVAQAVGDAPVEKIGVLVEASRRVAEIFEAEIDALVQSLSSLQLPPRDAEVEEHVGIWENIPPAGADDEDESDGLLDLVAEGFETLRVEVVRDGEGSHKGEDGVVA